MLPAGLGLPIKFGAYTCLCSLAKESWPVKLAKKTVKDQILVLPQYLKGVCRERLPVVKSMPQQGLLARVFSAA